VSLKENPFFSIENAVVRPTRVNLASFDT